MSQETTSVSVNGCEYDCQHYCDKLRDAMPSAKVLRVANAPKSDQFNSPWRMIEHDVAVLLGNVYFCPFCGEDLDENERIKNEKDNCLMH